MASGNSDAGPAPLNAQNIEPDLYKIEAPEPFDTESDAESWKKWKSQAELKIV